MTFGQPSTRPVDFGHVLTNDAKVQPAPRLAVRTHTVHKDIGESRLDTLNIKETYV